MSYEVVCPDGRVRHTAFETRQDAYDYERFCNRAGDGEAVAPGMDCEPNIDLAKRCLIPAAGRIQAHWVRDIATQQPLLDSCPVCGAWPLLPDKPVYDERFGRRVLVDVPCPKCPAAITYFVNTGHIVGFVPNQVLRVRRVRGR